MAQKSVKIDSELFLELLDYFLKEDITDSERQALYHTIRARLQIKKDSIIARIMYDKYIHAQGEERQALYQSYLNFVGGIECDDVAKK